MDKIQHHYHKSIFKTLNEQWWNPEISWKNKYRKNESELGVDLLRERFPFSRTFLVFVTDAFHLFKSIRDNSLIVAVGLSFSLYWILVFKLIYSGLFHYLYMYLFHNKK